MMKIFAFPRLDRHSPKELDSHDNSGGMLPTRLLRWNLRLLTAPSAVHSSFLQSLATTFHIHLRGLTTNHCSSSRRRSCCSRVSPARNAVLFVRLNMILNWHFHSTIGRLYTGTLTAFSWLDLHLTTWRQVGPLYHRLADSIEQVA